MLVTCRSLNHEWWPWFKSHNWTKWAPLLISAWSLGCYQIHSSGERAAIFSKGFSHLPCHGTQGRIWSQVNFIAVLAGRSLWCQSISTSTPTMCLVDKRGSDIIIPMNANSHSFIWGLKDANKRGDRVEEFIFYYDLNISNRGSQPTFVVRGSNTIIDITLCSINLVGSINRWRVDSRGQLPDHRRILLAECRGPNPTQVGPPRRLTWSKFLHFDFLHAKCAMLWCMLVNDTIVCFSIAGIYPRESSKEGAHGS